MKRLTNETIINLPQDVQNDVMSALRVYDFVNVNKIDGRWSVSPHSSLTAWAREIEYYGTAYQEDFYNEEERREIRNELSNCVWF